MRGRMHTIDRSFSWQRVTEEGEEEEGPPRGKTRPTRAVAEPQRQAACAQLLHLRLSRAWATWLCSSSFNKPPSSLSLRHHIACTPALANNQFGRASEAVRRHQRA